MAAASQLARRAGPAIYITLAFHRSPLTPRCLGPRPGGPRGSWRHPGTETGCEGPARPGKPWAWEGRVSSLIWAQGLRPPPCQPLMEGGGGHQGLAAPKREAGLEFRGFQVRRAPQELQAELLGTASSSCHSGDLGMAPKGGQTLAPDMPPCPTPPRTHSMPKVCNPHVPCPFPAQEPIGDSPTGAIFSCQVQVGSVPPIPCLHLPNPPNPGGTPVLGKWSPVGERTQGSGRGFRPYLAAGPRGSSLKVGASLHPGEGERRSPLAFQGGMPTTPQCSPSILLCAQGVLATYAPRG